MQARQRTLAILFLALLCAVLGVSAQSPSRTSSASSSSTSSTSPSLSLTTSTVISTFSTTSGTQTVPITTSFTTIFNVTVSASQTASANASASASPSASASAKPKPIVLDTKLDPAFGVLGGILILTGIPSAILGHKNRWTSFFLTGFYTLSLTCFVLIMKFGVMGEINPPSKTIRGMFVLASTVAGIVGGGFAIFFWKGARFFIGAWGGFAFGLWIQCFRDGGLIDPIGFRWIMFIGCAVIGFILCTIPKIHYHVVAISTAFVGATAFMLGIDCFTAANVKEFYVWNLGFSAFFTKYTSRGIRFPVSQAMQIELALLGAAALMGLAVQLRILKILQRKLAEIAEVQRARDDAENAEHTQRFAAVDNDRELWEKEHGGLGIHDRKNSDYSGMPLMKDQDYGGSPGTPASETFAGSTFDLPGGRRARVPSGLSDFNTRSQSPGAIPALDLGQDIENSVPMTFLDPTALNDKSSRGGSSEDVKQKDMLLAEIGELRQSIEILRGDSAEGSGRSRHASLTSRRTLSMDASGALAPPDHLRPPRSRDPRHRTQSMEMSDLVRNYQQGVSINRPTSVPLQDEDWDAYVRERKLLQPPAGVSSPIPTTPAAPPRAVVDALKDRRQRESSYEIGEVQAPSPTAAPTAAWRTSTFGLSDPLPSPSPVQDSQSQLPDRHRRDNSASNARPVTILPPRKPAAAPEAQQPAQPRTRTYEELAERHREKMRELQAPLSQAEKERADLDAAKARWERSKTMEREAVTKRQAERVAAKAREDKTRSKSPSKAVERPSGHTRSLSAEALAVLQNQGASSKRASVLKVEGWQRQQEGSGEPPRPRSRVLDASGGAPIPFPDAARQSRRMSGMTRGPVS